MKQFANAKGCPFCGSYRVEPRSGFGIVQVKCHECGAMFRFGAETDEQFIQKWNLRPRKHVKSTANNEQIARRELEQTLASLKKAMPGFIDAVEKALHETLDPYLSALGECLSKAEEVE